MNTKKTLKNSTISTFIQVLTLFFQIINRRIFVIFLDVDFLGYHSLFVNVFLLLSVAEAGIGNIVSFHLYKEIYENNEEEIGKLMYLYQCLYRFIAIIVFLLGCGCYCLLPYFIKESSISWSFLSLIYFLQLGGVVAGYFVSYRRTIYIVNQQEYKCIEIDLYTSVMIQIIQLLTLALFKNYLIYLILQISTTVISNYIILRKTDKDYPYLCKKYSVRKEDIKKRNFLSDAGNFVIHRISYAIYGGTDSIIIAACCGVRTVALYGSYLTIQSGVNQILNRFFNPLQAAIGNIIHSERKKEELWDLFEVIDILCYFLASYLSLGFLIFYQPVIQIWLGKPFLLPDAFVIIFSANYYFVIVWESVYRYRAVFGGYRQDRVYMICSAILNLIVSVWLAKRIGIVGIQIGTMIGYFSIAFGRIKFVIGDYFEKSIAKYLVKHFILFLVIIFEGVICFKLTKGININCRGMIYRGILWAVIPVVIGTFLNLKNPHFKLFIKYVKRVKAVVGDRFSLKNNK
ncbi:hypothetical protein D7X87_17940 [bacterium D16-54]|nr:hypothetical protein D7X87_17940 [bacterium D16-54]RKJ12708.1 hypothetical protein D7X65_18385 [bacterium D16-56]